MVILLDTHVLVWLWTGDPRIGEHGRKMLSSMDQRVRVSIASIRELAIKRSIGKLDLSIDPRELVASLPEFGFDLLGITTGHALALTSLPLHHRDPFDRMLIAQAKHEGMHLLTADPHFKPYDVPLVDL